MEVAQVGVKTKARATAASSAMAKKRKANIDGQLVNLAPSSCRRLKKPRHGEDDVVSASRAESTDDHAVRDDEVNNDVCSWSPSSSSTSDDHVQTSCCSSNGSSELVQDRSIEFVDLEDESEQVESWTCNSRRERRKMTFTSELQVHEAESDEVESTVLSRKEADNSRPRISTTVAEKINVTVLELEEFFAEAQKDLQKQFKEKYNFDFEKEEPLEGRYEWVRLKPRKQAN